jgi:hypothetical protein
MRRVTQWLWTTFETHLCWSQFKKSQNWYSSYVESKWITHCEATWLKLKKCKDKEKPSYDIEEDPSEGLMF